MNVWRMLMMMILTVPPVTWTAKFKPPESSKSRERESSKKTEENDSSERFGITFSVLITELTSHFKRPTTISLLLICQKKKKKKKKKKLGTSNQHVFVILDLFVINHLIDKSLWDQHIYRPHNKVIKTLPEKMTPVTDLASLSQL